MAKTSNKKTPAKAPAAKKPAAKHSVVVTVDDTGMSDFDGVANLLKAKGLTIDRMMPVTGVITGSVVKTKMAHLGKVRGVSAVEEELGVQLPSPTDGIQ